ncbi:lantibiotic dehydratase [Kutzneria kofuensis]|uniref:Thiopeptide-type bacteriocin biosynthesis protein n=1 Tax=Kutzneria kofuensis TaxID=103725 RepID=A0A7W9KP06_9PSEU|nr:lantibiotic dehydratase [Kutzneria kofuensis]MBB5896083.1 thiopeptide-type bacteriocin biosynthesis protein [Kutzneria kofuensis]
MFTVTGQAQGWICALPASAAEATRRDIPVDPVGYLREIAAVPGLREAIAVASTSLDQAFDRALANGLTHDRAGRVAFSVAKYLLRMATRPVPFGTMAGTATAEVGCGPGSAELGARHRREALPDLGWLASLVARWEQDGRLTPELMVITNDLVVTRGDRLFLATRPGAEISLRLTPSLRETVRYCGQPRRGRDLLDHLARTFPLVDKDTIAAAVRALIGHGVLCTDLAAATTLEPIAATLRAAGHEDAEAVAGLLSRCADYSSCAPEARRAALRTATRSARNLAEAPAPLQVDLGMDASVRFPRIVADELDSALSVSARLARTGTRDHALREYHNAFLARYGPATAVPLLEVFDSERGLGPYRDPAAASTPTAETQWRDTVLLRLAQQAVADGFAPVTLTEDVIDELAAVGHSGELPASVELSVEVLAESMAAIESGRFDLLLWTVSAGVVTQTSAAALAERDTMPVQLRFKPLAARDGNVLRQPRLLPDALDIGTFPAAHSLRATDLALAATSRSFHVLRRNDLREIEPVSFTLLRDDRSGDLERFLRVYRRLGQAQLHWSWGAAAALPWLPRVTHGRTVLSAQRWLIPRTLSTAGWDDALARWRAQWRVPDEVRLVSGTSAVDLDLRQGLHRELLRTETARNPEAYVSELPGCADRYSWLAGHASRLHFSAFRKECRRPVTVVPRGEPVRHLPGGEWLCLKLYASPVRHDTLLAEHLAGLVDALGLPADRWFFVRYADPAPHLRLRFRGSGADRKICSWAAALVRTGLAARFVIDEYEPESARYGGDRLIAAAEHAFGADSVAAVELLSSGKRHPLAVLCAVTGLDLVRQVHGLGWETWVSANLPHGLRGRRDDRKAALRLHANLPAELRTVLDERAEPLREYGERLRAEGNERRDRALNSLLHMHFNRLTPIGSPLEGQARLLARAIADTHRTYPQERT